MTLSVNNTPLDPQPEFPEDTGPKPERGPILVQEDTPPPAPIERPNNDPNN